MRHLWSSLAGLAAAPVVWVLLALGQLGSAQTIAGWEERGSYNTVDLIAPAAYLVTAGVVLGLLATLRVSPAGPLVAGVLLAGPYVAMFADPFRVRDAVPADRELLGEPLSFRLPLDNGTLLLVGVLLLMAVFSVQRWRRWPAPAAAPAAQAEVPEAPVEGTPSAVPIAVPDDADGQQWRRPAAEAGQPAAGAPAPVGAAPAVDGPAADRPAADRSAPDRPAADEPTVAGWPPPAATEPAAARAAGESSTDASPRPRDDASPRPGDPAERSQPDRSMQRSAPPPAESPWLAPPRQAHRENPGE
jgi:hypothetical protein